MCGLAIIVPKYFRKNISLVNCESWRLQAAIISVGDRKFLIINTYFPTDPKNVNGDNIELENLLAEIRSIVNRANFNYLYIAGDINCDFTRNTVHVGLIREFIQENNMDSLWSEYPVDYTHSYDNQNGVSSTHILDHILALTRAKEQVVDACVLHLVENMSDHEPIYAIIRTDHVTENESYRDLFNIKPKLKWKDATTDQKLEFNDLMFRGLMSLSVPDEAITCKDVHCKDNKHRDDIDKYVKEILDTVNECGKESIPTPPSRLSYRARRRKVTAGWKEIVEPYQDRAHFWHAVWVSAGRPMNSEVHRIMKYSRNRFHCQLRKCRRVENYIKNQKIVENCIENDTDLFNEIRKQRKNNNYDEVTIDDASGKEIPGKFATIYNELFNRGKDDEKIDVLKRKLETELGRDDLSEIDKINSDTIKEAMKHIKGNKSDSTYDFSSDFLKHGPDILYEHLANIIKTYAVHGHVTEHLLLATLVPLVKDKLGNICSSKNYRSIAISSLILKLFDWTLIINYGHLLKSNDFQFGFQQFSSTSLCSWVVYETIDHYLRNGSIVYGCLLDCSKAFDTIEHSKLFEKLLDAGMPKLFIRMLMFIYRNQTANVR